MKELLQRFPSIRYRKSTRAASQCRCKSPSAWGPPRTKYVPKMVSPVRCLSQVSSVQCLVPSAPAKCLVSSAQCLVPSAPAKCLVSSAQCLVPNAQCLVPSAPAKCPVFNAPAKCPVSSAPAKCPVSSAPAKCPVSIVPVCDRSLVFIAVGQTERRGGCLVQKRSGCCTV